MSTCAANVRSGYDADERVVEQHRDANVFVVEMPAVRPVPFAESLAVIARHHHNRVVEIPLGAECGEDLADDAVRLANLVVVAIGFVQLREDLVRLEPGADAIVRAREHVRVLELDAEIVRRHQVHVEERRLTRQRRRHALEPFEHQPVIVHGVALRV